jgi:glutamate---cysteine ligase / carboxylate-amine ligase
VFDTGQVFWDVRLGIQHPTVEFRIGDSSPTVDEALTAAALCRALVQTNLNDITEEKPTPEFRPVMQRSAKWRAARYGLDGRLLNPFTEDLVLGEKLMEQFLGYLRGPLEETGDWDQVSELVGKLAAKGTSDRRQRVALAENSRLTDVVDLLTREMAGS